jgi:hypothetical protein
MRHTDSLVLHYFLTSINGYETCDPRCQIRADRRGIRIQGVEFGLYLQTMQKMGSAFLSRQGIWIA